MFLTALFSVQCGRHFSRTVSANHQSHLVYIIEVFSVQCILFLAPLAFNERLEEDPTVNRLVRFFYPFIDDDFHLKGRMAGGQP